MEAKGRGSVVDVVRVVGVEKDSQGGMRVHTGLTRVLLKNASVNLVRLAGSGLIALLLPPFLARMLPKETYGAWALLMQITMYVGLLDFGIQTAVARFVAHADEMRNCEQRDGIASTALVLLLAACAFGLCLIGVMAWQLPRLFKAMPDYLYIDGQTALLLMGGSFAIGLPFSVIHAVFIGLQRNEVPAGIVLVNRFTMAAFTVAAVSRHWGLAAMGAAVAVANVLSYGFTYFAWRRWARHISIKVSLASGTHAKEVARYCAAMTVWFVGMLMVNGLDLSIVGIFQYSATAYYAVALTITNFIAQGQTAIFAALLPVSAVLAARDDRQKLGALLVSSTRYGMFILLAMGLPLIIVGKVILRVWVGAEYALHSYTIMVVLACANVIRLFALPYSILLLGSNQQGKVILSPLAEGVTNLAASVIGAFLWGGIGVAFGTAIGAMVSLGLHVFYNMPRTTTIAVNRLRLFKEALLRPLVCAAPFALLLLSRAITPYMSVKFLFITSAVLAVIAFCLFWYYGLVGSERRSVETVLRASLSAFSN